MRRLANAREILDGPLDDPSGLRGNLRDLRRVNRWLGGNAISATALDALVEHRRVALSMLDVGTGSADIPLALLQRSARNGSSLVVVAVDSHLQVLDAARSLDARLDDTVGLELGHVDGRTLPYPDRSFDVVHCSLLVHHLEPADAVAFLREARRVARRGVVLNDLVRARSHWVLARLLFGVMTRNPITRHDGPLSVRRAYTRMELRALLAAAGLRPVVETAALLGHRVAIAAVPIPAEPTADGVVTNGTT